MMTPDELAADAIRRATPLSEVTLTMRPELPWQPVTNDASRVGLLAQLAAKYPGITFHLPDLRDEMIRGLGIPRELVGDPDSANYSGRVIPLRSWREADVS